MKKLAIGLAALAGLLGLYLIKKTATSTATKPQKTEIVDHADPAHRTIESAVTPDQAGPTTPAPPPHESGSSTELQIAEAKKTFEKTLGLVLSRYESRLSGPAQLQCEVNLCSIRLLVDPNNEALRTELLREVRAKVMETIKANMKLIKGGTSNNNQPDLVVGEIEFYGSADEQKQDEEQGREFRKSVNELLNPAAFQEFKRSQGSTEPMKVVVLYLLRELQQNGRLSTVLKIDSDCTNAALCKFTMHHAPGSAIEAQSADAELITSAVHASNDVLHHGFTFQTLSNTPKDGATWFTLRPLKN